MNRLMLSTFFVLVCAQVSALVSADDPPKKLSPEERKELEARWTEVSQRGNKDTWSGKYPDAEKALKEALEIARQLYPTTEYPKGHPAIIVSLNRLALVFDNQQRLAEADPYYRASLNMSKDFYAGDHSNLAAGFFGYAVFLHQQGLYSEAELLYRDALEMYKRLHKGNNQSMCPVVNRLSQLLRDQGKYPEAEQVSRDALAMSRELFKGDHLYTLVGMQNLAEVYFVQGKLVEAEPLFTELVAMSKRRFKGDNSDVAASITALASLRLAQGKLQDAESLFAETLAMRRRLHKGDHRFLASSLNNLGCLYKYQRRYADAETYLKQALEMKRRLLKGDDLDVASGLSNLGGLYLSTGSFPAAERLFKESLEIRNRLLKSDHPALAVSLNDLAFLYNVQGRHSDAEGLYADALAMYRRLTIRFAKEKSEGDTLTLITSRPLTRDAYLSNELASEANAKTVYVQVWPEKGYIARVYERRQQQARAATEQNAAKMLTELVDVRRRRAELLLSPATKDPTTLKKRDEDIQNYESRITSLIKELDPLLPSIARADNLAVAQPVELQKVLPANAAVVDYLEFVHFEQDKDVPGLEGEKRTQRYLAFVVTRDSISWVNLDTAASIEPAVEAWREAITGDPLKKVPPASVETIAQLGSTVRKLVWDKVRKQLPANITTIYVCPDKVLCKVPFAALPGDRAGTILLEDFAIAVIPHAPFLLDQLWPKDKRNNSPTGTLVVGGVNYDADLASSESNTAVKISNPLVKPEDKLGWSSLTGTAGEAIGVAKIAQRKKLLLTILEGNKATSSAVLAALPRARVAHFATHGFFADPSFRSAFQLDEKDYEKSLRGERIGKAANSPLVMTGLVFAGANSLKTPGRGIVTGESLIDLDLSGLELAVLSACETGLGDVAGGEGVFGLQRAFHYAGTRNVIASLWKVDDLATAALMTEFYTNLWDKNLPPLEALRQAQLALFHADTKQFEAMAQRGFEDGKIDVNKIPLKLIGTNSGNHPALWAAFTLSGLGR
jgi:CHAT domain-containing protein/tetratricopeptide (TPR) repeat protein